MKMKRIILVVATALLALLCLASCDNNDVTGPVGDTYYTATFKFNNDQADYAVQVKNNELIPAPISPERENFIFNGWKNEGKIWDFTKDTIYADVTFTAQWLDASSIFSYSVNTDGTITVTGYNGKLTEIRIPEVISGLTVTAIGDAAFKGLDDLDVTLITVPKTVTSIGKSAFEGCDYMPITVLGKLSFVGEQAFDGCVKLNPVTLDESIDKISFRAFADCLSFSEIKIPKDVTLIEEDAFSGCFAAQTMLIMSSDFEVEDSAFAGCDNLVTIFYIGNETQWETVLSKVNDGGNGNDNLRDAEVFFYSETEAEGNFWHFNDKGQPRCW